MTKKILNRAAAAMTAIAGAAVLTFSTFAAYGYSEDVVSSAKFDPDIYDIILYEFDADDSGDMSEYELACITDLDLSDLELTSLRGISYLPNLAKLDASQNKLRNLSALKENTNLQVLDVSENNLTTLDGVGKLTKLQQLNANSNKIKNLGDIGDCSSLISADLSGNKIYSTSGLEDLEKITSLALDDNMLPSLGVLPAGLTSFSAVGNDLSELGGIKKLTKLTYLDVSDNGITSLEGLPSSVKTLYAVNNQLKSLAGLENLSGASADLSWNLIALDSSAQQAILKKISSGTTLVTLPQALSGWQLHGKDWYWFTDTNGSYATGSMTINGTAYWFDDYGVWNGTNTAPSEPVLPDGGSDVPELPSEGSGTENKGLTIGISYAKIL